MTDQNVRLNIEYSEEDEEFGLVYVASGVDIMLVTDGVTLDELFYNIDEAVTLHYDGDDLPEPPRISLNLDPSFWKGVQKLTPPNCD